MLQWMADIPVVSHAALQIQRKALIETVQKSIEKTPLRCPMAKSIGTTLWKNSLKQFQ
jgi:hypothetical protein